MEWQEFQMRAAWAEMDADSPRIGRHLFSRAFEGLDSAASDQLRAYVDSVRHQRKMSERTDKGAECSIFDKVGAAVAALPPEEASEYLSRLDDATRRGVVYAAETAKRVNADEARSLLAGPVGPETTWEEIARRIVVSAPELKQQSVTPSSTSPNARRPGRPKKNDARVSS